MSSEADGKIPTTPTTKRVHFAKNTNKKSSTPTGGLTDADDKQLYGFHPLRSLRNIFFGYRSKSRPLSAVTASKAKSTENLSAGRGDDAISSTTASRNGDKSTSKKTAVDKQTAYERRRSAPYKQMLSISADDLLETSLWRTAPASSTESRQNSVSDSSSTAAITSSGNVDAKTERCNSQVRPTSNAITPGEERQTELTTQEESAVTITPDEPQDFFAEKWSVAQAESGLRRAVSDEGLSCCTSTDDLDFVDAKYSLDVSIVKNKLAVKQKGKRATTALQQKITAAEHAMQVDEGRRSVSSDVTDTTGGDSQLNSLDERHSLPDDTELVREPSQKEPVESRPSTGESRQSAVPVSSATATSVTSSTTSCSTPPRAATSAAHIVGHKMLISSEQLTDAVRRAAASRSQQLQQTPTAPSSAADKPPTTTLSPPGGLAPPRGPVAPKPVDGAAAPGKPAAPLPSPRGARRTADDRNNNDGSPLPPADGVLRRTKPADDEAEEDQPARHTSLKQTGSATPWRPAAGAAAAMDTGAITGAAQRLKARPITMAPVSGSTASGADWMAELAAKKRARDATESTNM